MNTYLHPDKMSEDATQIKLESTRNSIDSYLKKFFLGYAEDDIIE